MFKSKNLFICLFIFLLFSVNVLFSQVENENAYSEVDEDIDYDISLESILLAPIVDSLKKSFDENKKEIVSSNTSLVIKTAVSGASVYLNNEYYGVTPVTINNLIPGTYNLKVSKNGYESFFRRVTVNKGMEYSYFITLEKKFGYLKISGIPNNSLIYADGTHLLYDINKLEEGRHLIKVRNFGYKDFETEIFIYPHKLKKINIKMKQADFSVTSFSASKSSFNPSYSGGIGETIFSANVTAPGIGSLCIKDSYGNIVFSHDFPIFATWVQSVSWNGCDNFGNCLPSGIYTATFSSRNYILTSTVRIDYDMAYHLLDFTAGGLGVGSIPLSLTMPKDTAVIGIMVDGVLEINSYGYSVPLSAALSYNINDYFELSANFKAYAKANEIPLSSSVAMKFVFSNNVGIGKLNYGLSISYGYSEERQYAPYGIAYGNGFNPALMFGYDISNFFIGITSQFDLGSSTGDFTEGDNVWKNAIVLSFFSGNNITIDLFSAIHSAFGIYNDITQKVDFVTKWFNSIEVGFGLSLMIPNSSAVFKLGGNSYIFSDEKIYLGFKIGLNYLF